MPTPPCWLPHLGGQKGKDALILAMFIFHFAAFNFEDSRSPSPARHHVMTF